jgi:hypothetical protein
VIVPGTPSETPAKGPVVETAGIEPAKCSRQAVIHVPLANRTRQIVAYALIDAQDAPLAEHRWYLDAGHAARGGKPYARRTVRQKGIYLHREVLALDPDDPRKGDHINGDTLDCRKANLRIVTVAENAQNQGSRGGSSEHRGVTWDKARGLWMATAMLNGKRTTIGRFVTEGEAAKAAAAWRAEHMPFSGEAA